jgi:hypothetical protein
MRLAVGVSHRATQTHMYNGLPGTSKSRPLMLSLCFLGHRHGERMEDIGSQGDSWPDAVCADESVNFVCSVSFLQHGLSGGD